MTRLIKNEVTKHALTKEAAKARVAANWEHHKHLFNGKTDQELRDFADQGLENAEDVRRNWCFNCMAPSCEALVLRFVFAAEEELRIRRSNL